MTTPKAGPLTEAELLEVWKGATDKAYRDPLLAAGDGNGIEAHTQAMAQLARASRAIDVTTQAMFICPWSGQTNPPAAGEALATVTLTLSRSGLLNYPLVLGAGTLVEEQTTDWGENGPEVVRTGRRYELVEDLVFHPGETGPFTVVARAEAPGYGYNNPLPGTLVYVPQPGNLFENDLATVTTQAGLIAGTALASSATAILTTPNQPDTFVPAHVGQYMLFTAGANQGAIARVIQFAGPNLAAVPPTGSTVVLEWTYAVEGVAVGAFEPGERVTIGAVDLFGRVLGARTDGGLTRLTFVFLAKDVATLPDVGSVLTGQSSGATLTVSLVTLERDIVAEAPVGVVGGASWRILDWVADWGLSVTNETSPDGGRAGWLDELGLERGLSRSPGETDEAYRQRVKEIADVVSPNAIRRTLNRVLGDIPWCFREVGTEYLPGFFFDGDNTPPSFVPHGVLNDAYDYDTLILTTVGPLPIGTEFLFQEPAEIEDAITGDNYAVGWVGRLEAGDTLLTFIRKDGLLPTPLPANVQVRGLFSGTTIPVSAETPNLTSAERRFRVWLDYSQFRGYFQVCVPPLGLGEFGFAYGDHPVNAFDAPSPYLNFYDGYPVLDTQVYQQVYQALDQVRAGGVLFGLCLDDGSCP